MTSMPLRLAVIIGSTREGRFGDTVARWFIHQAEQFPRLELDVVDLRDTPLPTVQQAGSVGSGVYASVQVRAFASRIDAADAFVVVTPEYNHGYPASLKLAIDSVYPEWKAKAVGFVSYGGQSGGLRAVEQLRQVFAELHTVTIRDTVSFPMARRQFDDEGMLRDPEWANTASKKLLDQLVWWANALRDARARQPYTF
ncbi:MAG: NAD(P)H-dependent oxidoreductase [Chloroflexi bacterium]|nr:NAD(P)H-dependent oxidoreductase [Chloroflexota bacterium]